MGWKSAVYQVSKGPLSIALVEVVGGSEPGAEPLLGMATPILALIEGSEFSVDDLAVDPALMKFVGDLPRTPALADKNRGLLATEAMVIQDPLVFKIVEDLVDEIGGELSFFEFIGQLSTSVIAAGEEADSRGLDVGQGRG